MQVPAPFTYQRATSVDHAIGLLEELGPSARLLAGGHSLLPMMRLRLANLDHVIDINDLHGELGYIEVEAGQVRIGAMTRHRELRESAPLTDLFPIFGDAEKVIADPPVRNRGTIGGSLCQADPAEDLSAVCAALDAQCLIRGRSGDRLVDMPDFHLGPYETDCGDAEILVEVRIPVRPGGSSAYETVERRAGDWAVASAGAAVWMDGGVVTDARIGLAGVGPSADGIPAVGDLLRGNAPSEDLYTRAGEIAAEASRPGADTRGSVEYKRHLVAELTRRTLRRSVERLESARETQGA